jgi:hypothetical protein
VSGVNPSGNIFPSGLIDLSAFVVEVIKKGVGNRRVRSL